MNEERIKELWEEKAQLSNSIYNVEKKAKILKELQGLGVDISLNQPIKHKEVKMADETKGIISTNSTDIEDEEETSEEGFIIEKADRKGVAVFRDYTKEGKNSKLKRLVRD